jgi:hypothetical protein
MVVQAFLSEFLDKTLSVKLRRRFLPLVMYSKRLDRGGESCYEILCTYFYMSEQVFSACNIYIYIYILCVGMYIYTYVMYRYETQRNIHVHC